MRMNASNVKSIDDLGGNRPAPGKYHVALKHVDESLQGKNDSTIVCEFEVLHGTVPGQEKKTHTEYFSISEKALVRLTRLAICLGLMQPGDDKDIRFKDALGGQLVIELEQHEYEKEGQKKSGSRITFMGMWPIDHADVRDVPKNKDALVVMHGQANTAPAQQGTLPSNGNGSGQAPAQGGQQQAPAASGAGGDRKWDGI